MSKVPEEKAKCTLHLSKGAAGALRLLATVKGKTMSEVVEDLILTYNKTNLAEIQAAAQKLATAVVD